MAESRAELSELSMGTMEPLKVPELPEWESGLQSDMEKLLTVEKILAEIDKRGISYEGIDEKLLKTKYDQKKLVSIRTTQEYLEFLNQKRAKMEREQGEDELQAERMKKAAELKDRTELLTAERERLMCAESGREDEFRSRRADVRLKLNATTKKIQSEFEQKLRSVLGKGKSYDKRRQALIDELKKKRTDAAQKARDQLVAIDDEERVQREQHKDQLYRLDKQIEEARRKSEKMAKMHQKGKITLEVIKNAQLETLREFEEEQRAIRAWYQQQRRDYLDQLKVGRAQAEQKLKVEREALASWREKERRALEIKREKIEEADRKFEERRIADRKKLEEKIAADAQKCADMALAAAQRREEAVLAEERKREEKRLELERKMEQKRREEEERKLLEEQMAEERKLQEQKFIAKRKQLEVQAALLSQRMEDYVLEARLEQEEQMKAKTITDKWKHMQSVVLKQKEAKTRWRRAKLAVMVGTQLISAVKNEQMLS